MNEGTRLVRLHGLPTALALATFGALLVLLGLLWAAQPVQAADFTVSSTADDGSGGTLREAIEAANANAEADLIEFSVIGDIILTEPLTITSDIEIRGSNAITISGNTAYRILRVEPGGIVALSDIRLVDGFDDDGKGGGINNSGDVTLTNVTMTANNASGSGTAQGGAIHNNPNSTLRIIDSTINDNDLDTGDNIQGGAIFNAGTLEVTGSTIADNDALNQAGSSTSAGGAILNNDTGVVIIEDSIIRNNSVQGTGSTNTGGGLFNTGTMTVTNSIVSENRALNGNGGGIYNTSGNLDVLNSAILTNTADSFGGGIMNAADTGSSTDIVNSTLANNTSNTNGGGSAAINSTTQGSLNFNNVTIVDNNGNPALVNNGDFFNMSIENSIVANNSDTNCAGTDTPILTSNGNNIFDDTTCASILTDQTATDPVLGPLTQEAGETTPSYKPQANSPAINGGNNASCEETDQHGTPRPQGAACDVGSVELPLDLAISKAVIPETTINKGEQITYTIALTNASSFVTATNVLIEDDLPAQVNNVTFSTSEVTITQAAEDDNPWRWTIAEFGPGATGTIIIVGTIGGEQANLITNTVTISDRPNNQMSSTEEANTANNTDSVTTEVVIPPPTPPIANDDPGPGEELFAQVNTPLTIDVLANDANTATDSGNDQLQIIEVSAPNAGNTVSISASTELVYTATVTGPDVFTYTITNEPGTGPFLPTETDVATVTLEVLPEGVEGNEAELSVNITADKTLVLPGDELAYTINMSNNGPQQATSLTATIALSDSVTYVDDTGSDAEWTCTLDPDTNEVTCLRETLDENLNSTIVINTTVNEVTTRLADIVGDFEASVELRAANLPDDLPIPNDSVSVTLDDGLLRLYLPLINN
jgi:uncharacterized repeat protein (TIGR01451 family)